MKTRGKRNGSGGFILATVLVFLLVLSVTGFFAAGLSRANQQEANNVKFEKTAFAVAEAGIHEALYRMSIASPANVTISGVNGGSAFNASLQTYDTSLPNGTYALGLNTANTASKVEILNATGGPPTSGSTNNIAVPTLQPVAARRLYSTGTTAVSGGTIDMATTTNLTIGWDVCTATSVATGCSGAGAIRQLPVGAGARPVAKVVSTGRVVRGDGTAAASRKLTVLAADIGGGEEVNGNGNVVTLGGNCSNSTPPGGIYFNNGNGSVDAEGSVQINAGANSSPPSSCAVAIQGGNNNDIISGASVNTVGRAETTGNAPSYDPAPTEGVTPIGDPFASLQPPCWYGGQTGCSSVGTLNQQNPAGCNYNQGTTSTSAAPRTCSIGSGTISPGIYYGGLRITGNVTMQAGIYVMAGGGFATDTGNTSFSGTNVMVYNTRNDATGGINTTSGNNRGGYGSFDLATGNAACAITPPTTGTYQGVALYQDPQNFQTMRIASGNSSDWTFNGSIYLKNAQLRVENGSNLDVTGNIVVQSMYLDGGASVEAHASGIVPPSYNPTGITYTAIAWQDF